MDVRSHNRETWNKQVEWGNDWTIPVTSDKVAAARKGKVDIYLTPTITIPDAWFPQALRSSACDVLCLASGGGQQGPIMAATGANVTVFDNSPAQLAQDRTVAERDGLEITTIEGDMRDLAIFDSASFDLILHPVSNCFIPDVLPVWREAYRVLLPGGSLLSGFNNPARYLQDYSAENEEDKLRIVHKLPYDDAQRHTEEEIQQLLAKGEALEFSHMLDTLIGGQIAAGFVIAGFYEDTDRPGGGWRDPMADFMPLYIATRAVKFDAGSL